MIQNELGGCLNFASYNLEIVSPDSLDYKAEGDIDDVDEPNENPNYFEIIVNLQCNCGLLSRPYVLKN